jgi:hypothetical protein
MVKRLESPLCRVSVNRNRTKNAIVHTTNLVRERSCHAGESHCNPPLCACGKSFMLTRVKVPRAHRGSSEKRSIEREVLFE